MSVPPAPLDVLGPLGMLGGSSRLLVEGAELSVAGWIAYDDEWVEYLLTDSTWLCVEEGNPQKLSRWWDQSGPAPALSGGRAIVHGRPYREVETYTSEWRAAGIGDLMGSGTVRVSDLVSETDPSFLAAIEDWGDGPELSIGKTLAPDAVVVL